MKAAIIMAALAPGLAASSMVPVPHGKRGPEEVHRLYKRYGGQATFFNVEENEVACGGYYKSSQAVVALNQDMFGDLNSRSKYCNMMITISYKGKSKQAKIVDACPRPGCQYGALDMSTSLFDFFENPDAGVFPMTWSFGGGGGDDGGEDDKPKTTTTHPPTPTSTPTPTPTPSSSSIVSSSSSAVNSTSAPAISIGLNITLPLFGDKAVVGQGSGNLIDNSQIIINFGHLLAVAARS